MGKKNRLKEIIADRGIKQAWIAERAGMSNQGVSELVNEHRAPSLDTARKIARALGMSIDDIWPEEGDLD